MTKQRAARLDHWDICHCNLIRHLSFFIRHFRSAYTCDMLHARSHAASVPGNKAKDDRLAKTSRITPMARNIRIPHVYTGRGHPLPGPRHLHSVRAGGAAEFHAWAGGQPVAGAGAASRSVRAGRIDLGPGLGRMCRLAGGRSAHRAGRRPSSISNDRSQQTQGVSHTARQPHGPAQSNARYLLRELESIASQPSSRPADTQSQGSQRKIRSRSGWPSRTRQSLELLQGLLLRSMGPIASAVVVIILMLFMLVQWEDVRDRLRSG